MPQPTKVTLYSTTTCPFCKMQKAWFDETGVKYSYVLVDQDPAAARDFVEKTGQMGVPVTQFDYVDTPSTFVIGYDRAKLSSLLS